MCKYIYIYTYIHTHTPSKSYKGSTRVLLRLPLSLLQEEDKGLGCTVLFGICNSGFSEVKVLAFNVSGFRVSHCKDQNNSNRVLEQFIVQ